MRTHTNAHTYKRAHAWQDQPMLQNAEHTQHHRSTCLVSACSTALCCVAVLCCVVLCCVVVCCSVVWCVVLLGHSEKKDEGKKHTVGLEVAGGEAYVKTPLSSRSLWFVFTCLFFASRCSRHCGQRTCTHTHTHTHTNERASEKGGRRTIVPLNRILGACGVPHASQYLGWYWCCRPGDEDEEDRDADDDDDDDDDDVAPCAEYEDTT